MRDLFHCEVGVSDHTMGVGVSVAAVALGATVIEKHFTLARSEGGVDSAFSLEPAELKTLVAETSAAWQSRGRVSYGPLARGESGSVQFRRSLYFVQDLPAGTTISAEHIRSIRPGYGLPPKHRNEVIGSTLRVDVRRGSPVTWRAIS